MNFSSPNRLGSVGLAKLLLLGMAIGASGACSLARAELPLEQLTMEKLDTANSSRLYLVDPAMGHIVDGRLHVIDGVQMRYLGMLGTGFAGTTVLSRDRKTLFVATTYHSRLQRGTRNDVVEVYGSDDLAFQHEIEIPPKHVQGLQTRALLATSADDKFLLVQNATPATSVSIVDVLARRFLGEIPTPGCYGVLPWPNQPRRFSSVCGDGKLASYDFDGSGSLSASSMSQPFFDPDQDPVFMYYELVGAQLTFVSYHGQVHQIGLAGAQAELSKPWNLLTASEAKRGWRPGGLQLFAIDPRTDRLYVGMHDHGAEGTHKNPAKEIWVYDLKTHRRVARMPGYSAVAMAISRSGKPRMFVLNGTDNRIVSLDLGGARPPAKPLARSEPLGETPVFLELH
ncbi:MAG: amine dehydrogenase large subunit [Betaproteobacteria bacterium]